MTSYLFPEARFSLDHLKAVLVSLDDNVDLLVIDLSCRRTGSTWTVAMNKWQTLTDMEVNEGKRSPPSLTAALMLTLENRVY